MIQRHKYILISLSNASKRVSFRKQREILFRFNLLQLSVAPLKRRLCPRQPELFNEGLNGLLETASAVLS